MKKEMLFWGGAAMVYGIIFLAFAACEDILIRGLWKPYDIASYYWLASRAVSSITAIVDASASSSMLLLGLGTLSGYRIFIVSLLLLASAILVMGIGRRSYGNAAGFLAGLIFTFNIAWVQGHLTVGEALAIMLTLLSASALLFMGDGKYIVSGLIAGAALCLKPFLILLLPASLLAIYRKGGPGDAFVFIGVMLLPLTLITTMAITVYGPAITVESGFEAIGFLADEGYRSPDALMAVADIVLAVCMLISLLPLALLGFSRKHGMAEEYFLAAGLCFVATIVLKQYLHYWFIALPFLALLCASVFSRGLARG
jgi:hypothetical protein